MTCMQAVFAGAFTVEEVQALARVLYAKALEGNLTAAKMILPYILGKPSTAPKTPEPEESPTAEPTPQPVATAPLPTAKRSDVPPIDRPAAPIVGASLPPGAAADSKLANSPPRVLEASEPRNPTRLLDRRAGADSNERIQ